MKKCIIFLIIFLLASLPFGARADDIAILRAKIEASNQQIAQIEAEIAEYQKQIQATGDQAKTLQSAIKTLQVTKNKLQADLSLTQSKLNLTQLSLQDLGNKIQNTEESIVQNREAIASSLREIDYSENVSLIEALMTYENIGELWNGLETLREFRDSVSVRVSDLKSDIDALNKQKAQTELKKKDLTGLKAQLSDQKKILDQNQAEKNSLLAATKANEASYKKILAEKQALRDAFQKELTNYESQLQFAIDPSRLPQTGQSVLYWPLDNIRITQYYGNTAFAQAHAQAYNGMGHNGIDLAASVGTPIKASLGGVIDGTGDTDTACPGASYGKWVLIRHANGLSTLYAHLSLIKVSNSLTVNTGDIIGYSGKTGYATGPHLHFTVYATQGVRVLNRKSIVCNATYTMPLADYKAYLNPMDYLPAL